MRFRGVVGYATFAAATAVFAVAAEAQTCARGEFEKAVDDTGGTLRALAAKNTAAFQEKLNALKAKRGWTQDQLLAEGARLLKDDKIDASDAQASALLAKINTTDGGADAASADCSRLTAIKADLAKLVDLQTEKWTYLIANVDAELSK